MIAQVFYDLHVIEHYGSGVRRIRNDCAKNGSPYPVWQSEHGECTIKFFARTKESIAKLGIDPEKFGVVVDGERGVMDTEKGIKVIGKVTENVAQVTEKVTENIGDVAENTMAKIANGSAEIHFTESEQAILKIVTKQPRVTQEAIAKALNFSRPYVARVMLEFQSRKLLRRNGPDKGGHWEVLYHGTKLPRL